jgi:hypothetical protein
MASVGIEFSDAGTLAAAAQDEDNHLLAPPGEPAPQPWPGFALHDGVRLVYGPAAEDAWLVHPRRVANGFLSRLTHDPVQLNMPGKAPSNSELAYHFLREFMDRVVTPAVKPERLAIAVPGAYLKDDATEEERVGLLLGIAHELKLPLAAITDTASAGLGDPLTPPINPTFPVVVIDLHLLAAEITLLGAAERRMARRAFAEVPQAGMAQLLKHLTGAMGNRFLRHTTFDILADGRIEQMFYRQTKQFVRGGAPEYRYLVNTDKRSYEMTAKHDQLVADTQSFIRQIETVLQSLAVAHAVAPGACTVVLAERAASVPGLEARLRLAGYRRILRLAPGAAARGAARLAQHGTLPAEMTDVAVETSLPLAELHRGGDAPWRTQLHKARGTGGQLPTHIVLAGTGHPLGGNGTYSIGTAGSDLNLPEAFDAGAGGGIALVNEGGKLWLAELSSAGTRAALVAIEAGDRLTVQCGSATADLLFVHCLPAGARG